MQRARLRASQDHFTRARRHVANRRLEEAVAEYKLAAELNPDNRDIAEELEQAQNQLRTQVVISRDGKTELEALVDRMRDQRLPGLDVAADPLPDELNFRDASNQVIIRALATDGESQRGVRSGVPALRPFRSRFAIRRSPRRCSRLPRARRTFIA